MILLFDGDMVGVEGGDCVGDVGVVSEGGILSGDRSRSSFWLMDASSFPYFLSVILVNPVTSLSQSMPLLSAFLAVSGWIQERSD